MQNWVDRLIKCGFPEKTANVLRFPNAWTFNGGVFPPAAAAAA